MSDCRPSYLLVMYSFSLFWKIYHLETLTRFQSGMIALVLCYMVNFICPATYSLVSLVVPLCMCIHTLQHESNPSVSELLVFMLMTVVFIGVSMSICLHRYFSHNAFETSRPMQFILGLVSCFAYQGDPLWWAVMHFRHHKYCDIAPQAPCGIKDPLGGSALWASDPHSVSHSGVYYAFIGWIIDPLNYDLKTEDYSCLAPGLMVPELRMLARLHMLPPLTACLLASNYLQNSTVLFTLLLPMVTCRIITLLFNVEYHPTNTPQGQNNICKAVDNNRFLAQLVGESKHKDHHAHPRRARRPDWDLPYLLVLRPLELVGCIWNLK